MGLRRLGVLHWRCWRSLPAACLPVFVPKSTASLSSLGSPGISPPPWRYMGHSWYPELLSCCWGVASSLSDNIFSLHGDWQHLFSQITYFLSRNHLNRVSQPFFFFKKGLFWDVTAAVTVKALEEFAVLNALLASAVFRIFFLCSGPSRKKKDTRQ